LGIVGNGMFFCFLVEWRAKNWKSFRRRIDGIIVFIAILAIQVLLVRNVTCGPFLLGSFVSLLRDSVTLQGMRVRERSE
jgi:hypothetical protein